MPSKIVRLGKFSKRRVPEKDNQFVWTVKQTNKLTGAESRKLKAALDEVSQQFIRELYPIDQ